MHRLGEARDRSYREARRAVREEKEESVIVMTREKKILQIQELIGVPIRDREITKKNFDRLSDAELDAKLADLEARERRIEAWQRTRGES